MLIFINAPVQAEVVTGTCGRGVRYDYDLESSLLRIYGEGDILDYSYENNADETRSVTTAPWGEYYDKIQEVEIEDGVLSIGMMAFKGCTSISKVVISNSVSEIGESAFGGCTNLVDVTLPNALSTIPSNMFSSCKSLKTVNIPNTVTSINYMAFAWCDNLEQVILPEGLKTIGNYAFYNCPSLAAITFPSSLTVLESSAFADCKGLTSVTIPTSLTSISYSAFSGCSGLKKIEVEEGNLVYDSRNNCNSIIKTQTNELILGCSSTTIPNTVKTIGDGAFRDSNISSISIPELVTSIGSGAFRGCIDLVSINLPNSLHEIGRGAFLNCTGLKQISFGSSLTYIDGDAFEGCDFTSVTVTTNTPPKAAKSSFSNYITTLYVPAGCVDVYSSTEPWSNFARIIGVEVEPVWNCSHIHGDVNGDGVLTIDDLTELVDLLLQNNK